MVKKLILLVVILALASIFFVIIPKTRSTGEFVSPLPRGERVLGINRWQPASASAAIFTPSVTAKAALLIDTRSGQVFFAKNIHERLPVASLVKVMTTLIALERKKMDDEFTVSRYAAGMEPDKMLLIAGERLTLKELLYGIFLISANDAAEVLAEGTLRQAQGKQGSRDEFIKLMNIKAKQLGMENSLFVNPTGLDEDSRSSYSTVYDLVILSRYLIRHYPQVVDISSQYHVYLPLSEKHQDYDMYSGVNLLTTYPGVVGFKTGYTPEAGMTLITLARQGEREVLGVLLGSQSRRDEAKSLLNLVLDAI
ncbi:D-alanyl-D-alanine carboxypeptidase [Candidatus Daviesbacteria bacterium]|nr:D-alanyl-D-alanine carboxypeptidase [Candidatus Daviesbacteria bacterium]